MTEQEEKLKAHEAEFNKEKAKKGLVELLRNETFSTAVVIGSPGTGKSTLVAGVATELDLKPILADDVHGQNPFFGPDKTDRKRWAFSSNVWFLSEKSQLIRDHYPNATLSVANSSRYLMDSGLIMGKVYARMCLAQQLYTQEEFELFQKLSDQLSAQLQSPELIIRLRLPVLQIRERILQRGRAYEINRYDEEYLNTLEAALEDEWRVLQSGGYRCLDYNL